MLAVLFAACAHPPAPAPAPVVPAANPAAPMVSPERAAGIYDLTTTLTVSRPAPRPRRGRRPTPGPMLSLDTQPLAALDATATSSTQLVAGVAIPGYTQPPRGRTLQAAEWWPVPGDSVVVHFQTPRGDGLMELRGALVADTLAGGVWFTSAASGSTYEMATFKAVKRKR